MRHGVVERVYGGPKEADAERLEMEADAARRVADSAVTVAFDCCMRAGYNDLWEDFARIKTQTARRRIFGKVA